MEDDTIIDPKFTLSEVTPKTVFWPGLDPGMYWLQPQSIAPVSLMQNAKIEAFFASTGHAHLLATQGIVRRHQRFRNFEKGIEFPSLVVAADDVAVSRAMMTINGKYFISGASGGRMIVKMHQTADRKGSAKFQRLTDNFAKKRHANGFALPLAEADARSRDFVLIAKNLFNYYHFTIETLSNLCLYAQFGLTGRIIIHAPNERLGGFVKNQIDLFFPEICDRVFLHFGPLKVKKALVVLDTRLLYYQVNDTAMPMLDDTTKSSWLWENRKLTSHSFKSLTMNSYLSPLRSLREQVLDRVHKRPDEQWTRDTPRLIYIRRKAGERDRHLDNEDVLWDALAKLGFETIYYEDYDVLEQARLVSQADVIISIHGAGMTNMLYANASCLMVELSSLQIAKLRFGDFNACALISGARYLHYFIDHDWQDQVTLPNFREDGLVGLRIDANGMAILRSIILDHLNPGEASEIENCARALNKQEDKTALAAYLQTHFERIVHLTNAHVWSANCAMFRGDDTAALTFLRNATKLAPGRKPLMERTLILARRLDDADAFDEVARSAFFHVSTHVESFFEQMGWHALLQKYKQDS